MSHDKLVYMANQIATFFQSMPQNERAAGVADHINKFWEPRMRTRLFAVIDGCGAGLSSLLLEAAQLIHRPRDKAAPRPSATA